MHTAQTPTTKTAITMYGGRVFSGADMIVQDFAETVGVSGVELLYWYTVPDHDAY